MEAEVTVVGEKVLNSLESKKLQTSIKRLCQPDQTPLQVPGEIPVTLAYKNRSCYHPVSCKESSTKSPWTTSNPVTRLITLI